jgi:hypothetical protein
MVRSLALVLAGVAIAATTADAGTKFISTWKSPDAAQVSFAGKKTAALVLSGDENLRISGEEALARELSARGVQGVAAYRVIPKEELTDTEKAKGWFQKAGVEGVVVMRLIGTDRKENYAPIAWTAPYYGSFWGYYGYGWSNLYTPVYTGTDIIVSVETLIFSVTRDKLLWAGRSESKNPKELQKSISELVVEAVKEMKKQGLAGGVPR